MTQLEKAAKVVVKPFSNEGDYIYRVAQNECNTYEH